jgi:ribosomal protein L7/L12
LIGVIFFFRVVQAASGERDPLVVRQNLRAQVEALALSAGPLRETFRSPKKFSDVAELILRKQKSEAIKLTREDTGLGLKEAKELVEQIEKAARRAERAGV